MIQVGVIGYGYWGPNLVRNFAKFTDCQVNTVCDRHPEQLTKATAHHPTIKTTTDCRTLIDDHRLDAIVICSPLSTHYELARQVLAAGKHVLVEKPIAAAAEQAMELIELAEKHRRVLMVDHTFVYHPAVRKIRELIDENQLGELLYYDSVRVNLGLFQSDINVLWDLAVHDLSIMDYLLPSPPTAISVHGISHFPDQPTNMAYLTLFFSDRLLAHIHVNWLAPMKIRRILLGGSERMIVYDDLEPMTKIKICERGVRINNDPESIYQVLYDYRSGDIHAPRLATTEALESVVRHFLDCIEENRSPQTDGLSGLRLVRMLEAADRSLHRRGEIVELNL